MKYDKILLFLLFFFCVLQQGFAQQGQGRFSGNLQANGNIFLRDSAIGAANTPQYDHQYAGAESWLNLLYSNWGFDVGVRFDLYNNSNLLNPQNSDNIQGIGRWFIKKKIHKLGISAGYLYDQVGSGIIFRAYEERSLGIDNSLYGLRLKYHFSDDWSLKAFAGKQRKLDANGISIYQPMIKGVGIDGFYAGKSEKSAWSVAPGAGIINRTLDDDFMQSWEANISITPGLGAIESRYNVFAFSVYNTLTISNLSWYIEGAFKTAESLFVPFAETDTISTAAQSLIKDAGSVFYTTMSYARKGFGVTLEYKRTENFGLRVNHNVSLNRGMLNFLPPMTRVNTFRLPARYTAATQEDGEQAIQLDFNYRVNKKLLLNINFSNTSTLKNNLLYQEILTEATYKYSRKWQLIAGLQLQNYNQAVYLEKPGKGVIQSLTPYAEFLYKLDRKKSLRLEAQYMATGVEWAGSDFGKYKGDDRDYGDWLFFLAEFGLAPHWSFELSDMFNINPVNPDNPQDSADALHYPTLGIVYNYKSNRFSLRYVKQVEGVVCTGGICRVEPAFSGFRMTVNSTF